MPSETGGPVILPPSIVNDISYYDHTWYEWIESSTTSAGNVVINGDVVWGVWTSETGTGSYTRVDTISVPQETSESAQAPTERLEQQRREANARAEKHRESEQKALELLRASLSPEQRKQFDESNENCFDVEITDPRMTTLVKKLRMRVYKYGEVREVEEDGTMRNTYCIVAPMGIPTSDVMLAKMLMLEYHPEDFFRIANRHAMAL